MKTRAKIPSYIIAIEAKIKWEKKDLETAIKESCDYPNGEEVLKSIGAINSVNTALESLSNILNLTKEEQKNLKEAVYNGPLNAKIFKIISLKAYQIFNQNREELILKILEDIHNNWVKNNSDEKTFNKKEIKGQLRQYLPLELIGFNEVESDLLFIEPILYSIGIEINREKLQEKYHLKLKEYLKKYTINNQEDLEYHISLGKEIYSTLKENNIESNIKNKSHIIAEQLINNWYEQDNESFTIFENRKRNRRL